MINITKQYFDSCLLSTIHTWKRYLTFMDITWSKKKKSTFYITNTYMLIWAKQRFHGAVMNIVW